MPFGDPEDASIKETVSDPTIFWRRHVIRGRQPTDERIAQKQHPVRHPGLQNHKPEPLVGPKDHAWTGSRFHCLPTQVTSAHEKVHALWKF
jgi:hypothetical protein